MAKQFFYRILMCLILALVACEKDPIKPPPVQGIPVFKLQGTFNGEPLLLEAGENDVLMETFVQKFNGVDCFSGKLTSDGGMEALFGIYNGNIDIPSTGIPAVPPNPLVNFATLQPSSTLVVLSKNSFSTASSMNHIVWKIDGVNMGQDDVTISQPGKYLVCAEIHFNNGTVENLCNELCVGYKHNATCNVKSTVQAGNAHLWLENANVPIDNVKWFIDGQEVSTQEDFTTSVTANTHLVSAEICFQNGVRRKQSMLIDGTGATNFAEDFSFFEGQSSFLQWDFNAKLIIKKDGKYYSSIYAPNQTKAVIVEQFSYFGKNAAGKSVYIICGTIDCMLKEVNSSIVVPFNATIRLGIALE